MASGEKKYTTADMNTMYMVGMALVNVKKFLEGNTIIHKNKLVKVAIAESEIDAGEYSPDKFRLWIKLENELSMDITIIAVTDLHKFLMEMLSIPNTIGVFNTNVLTVE